MTVDRSGSDARWREPVAIIGLGCVFPGASGWRPYWNNILERNNFIRQVPEDRWKAAIHYDPSGKDKDKSPSQLGAFVEHFHKDPVKFRIPPVTAAAMDRSQFFVLEAAWQALEDAGMSREAIPRERTGVFIGSESGGADQLLYELRVHWDKFARAVRAAETFGKLPARSREFLLEEAEAAFKNALPAFFEDTLPGTSGSLIAGRICHSLDLMGIGVVVNCACASSLAAVDAAVQALREGRLDLALAGGADARLGPETYVYVGSSGVLSDTGCFPFDERANGMVLGEGAGLFLLKRAGDAVRDKNRIYALIRGLAYSSDGRSKGITAPDVRGQIRSLRRAYEELPFSPDTVSLIEAHGTGTWVGDGVEFRTLTEFFRPRTEKECGIGLGSVKSMIGHLRAGAGAAGLMKAALALHHGILPPTLGCEHPRRDLDWENSPLYVLQEARPWPEENHPRRAGVNAFGFGGINYHAVLEEARPGDIPFRRIGPAAAAGLPGDLLVFRAPSRSDLVRMIRRTKSKTTGADKGAIRRLRSELCRSGRDMKGPTLAVVARDSGELQDHLERALIVLGDESRLEYASAGGVYFGQKGMKRGEKVAFVFSGQGSQYPGMAGDLPDVFPSLRDIFSLVNSFAQPNPDGSILEMLCFNENEIEPERRSRLAEHLKDPDLNHPLMLALAMGLSELLVRAGVGPDMVAGHSLGEYFALRASGVFDIRTAVSVALGRGRGIAGCANPGAMAAAAAGAETVAEVLDQEKGFAVVANKNCPVQTVISGEREAVERATAVLEGRGVACRFLPVSHAFHTKLMKPVCGPFREFLERFRFYLPNLPVQCNLIGRAYDVDDGFPSRLKETLVRHLAEPVDFMGNIRSMYETGARLFIEVGPGSTLCSFIDSTLAGRPHWTAITNHPRRSASLQMLHALAFCAARGLRVDMRGIIPDDEPEPAFVSVLPSSLDDTKARDESRRRAAQPEKTLNQKIWAKVVEAVCRTTGYPAELITPDLDADFELGLDSIKQSAIARELEEELGVVLPSPRGRGRYVMTTLRRLAEDLARLSPFPEGGVSGAPSIRLSPATKTISERRTECHRWLCEAVKAPFPAAVKDDTFRGRRLLLLAKPEGPGRLMKQLIEGAGGEVRLFLPSDSPGLLPTHFDAVLDLWGYGPEDAPDSTGIGAWWERLTLRASGLLCAAQQLIRNIRSGAATRPLWVEVTSLGGTLGAETAGGADPAAGTGLALLRALREEVPELESVTVDFREGVPETAAAGHVLDELRHTPRCREVGYTSEGRHELRWKADDGGRKEFNIVPDGAGVVLAVGGAHGITAAICRGLAARTAAQFIIIGRSPVGEDKGGATKEDTFARVWQSALEETRARGGPAAPTEIDRLAWEKIRLSERAANLRRIREAGGRWDYRVCDITDLKATLRLAEDLRRDYGRLDLVIQGGGDVTLKSVQDFRPEEFVSALRSKALGTASLLAALDGLEVGTFVNISSVAGRWSDAGQSAYGAGHEVASLLVAARRGRHPGRWMNIYYGPWAQMGMTRMGDADERLRARGVNFVTEQTGVEAFLNEAARETSESVGFCGREFPGRIIGVGRTGLPGMIRAAEEAGKLGRLLGITNGLAMALVDLESLRSLLAREGAAVLSDLLSAEEIGQVEGFAHNKKRVEWAGGRLAAKSAAAGLLGRTGPPPRALRVEVSAGSAPRLQFPAPADGVRPPVISITHSHGTAAALASREGRLGLDVELIDESLFETMEGFCGPGERDILKYVLGVSDAEILTRLWTIKESALKAVGTGIPLKDLRVAGAALKGNYLVARVGGAGGTTIRSVSWVRGRYAFAVSRLGKRRKSSS